MSHVHILYSFLTHIDIWVEELCPGVAGEHVDDDDLTPFLHINQQVTQLPVVLVDQVDALRAHFLKGHNNTSCYQLQSMFNDMETQSFFNMFCMLPLSTTDTKDMCNAFCLDIFSRTTNLNKSVVGFEYHNVTVEIITLETWS